MAYGISRVAQVNTVQFDQPSESIWADCNSQQALDEGTGFFEYTHFTNNVTLPGLPNTFTVSANAGNGFAYNTTYDHVANATTGTLAQAFIQTYTRPLIPVAAGSGQKIWFETEIALSSITANTGVFVGLANLAGLVPSASTVGLGIVAAASATKGSNQLGAAANTSLIGFWAHGDAATNFDAVYMNAGQNAIPTAIATNAKGSVQTVLVNTLTAAANNPNPANLGFTPPTAPGTLVAAATAAASKVTSANGFVKLGISYDGQQYVRWFVNGTPVAKAQVDSTFDQTSTMGGVVCLTVPSTTAVTLLADFIRVGAKEY